MKKMEALGKWMQSRKYYIAVALCILTVGAVSVLSYQNAKNVWDDSTLPEQNATGTDEPLPETEPETESASKPTKVPEQQKAKEYILPVDGKIDVGFSGDTPVYSKTLADWRTHSGIDYIVPLGTVVKAVQDGVVKSIVTDDLMGVSVCIKHTDGYESIYANLENSVTLKKDQLIKQGDTVGKVGKTAIIEVAQEPHLHFEMSLDGKNVDPLTLYGK